MACIDDIVSLGICSDEVSASGFTLMSAAGMSPLNGEKIATEQYGNGITMFREKKKNAINFVRNDFIGVLQANNIASTITEKLYESSYFNAGVDLGTASAYRGIILNGVHAGTRGGIRKLKIVSVQAYPLVSGVGDIVIQDSISGIDSTTTVAVTFVANKLNTFVLPQPYITTSNKVMILVDNTTIHLASTTLSCQKGCSGSTPNPCAWAEGWNGTNEVRNEGYGLNIQYTCACDYDSLICDFGKAFTGELIWLKWQELVYEEQYKSNRWTSWVTYNRDDIWNNILPDIRFKYQTKFNKMVEAGLFNMLKQYNDDCLTCRGIRVVTNM